VLVAPERVLVACVSGSCSERMAASLRAPRAAKWCATLALFLRLERLSLYSGARMRRRARAAVAVRSSSGMRCG
jgi:hypothetical protein